MESPIINIIEDTELVKSIKDNTDAENSINALIQKHVALVIKIASKYGKPLYDSGSSLEEILSEKEFIVYKAAMTYSTERNTKFSTYLGSYTRWYCLNKINENSGWKLISETPMDTIPAPPEKPHLDIDRIHYLLEKIHDPRIKKIFELRYFGGGKKVMSWNVIGQNPELNCSGQNCNNLHKKGLKLLINKFKGELDVL